MGRCGQKVEMSRTTVALAERAGFAIILLQEQGNLFFLELKKK